MYHEYLLDVQVISSYELSTTAQFWDRKSYVNGSAHFRDLINKKALKHFK